jgi:hypothetical protein
VRKLGCGDGSASIQRRTQRSVASRGILQELADEAFRDLLKKHRRPVTLKEMLRESARSHPANDRHRMRKSGP